MNDADHLWAATAQLLRAQVSEAVWLSTFQDAHPLVVDGERLLLSVPNSHVKERIEGRYLALVRDALLELGQVDVDLAVEVRPDRAAGEADVAAVPTQNGRIGEETADELSALGPSVADDSNPRYTFETFVKGA